MQKLFSLLWATLVFTACSGAPDPTCDKSALDHAPAISGVIYLDGDGSDASLHECGYDRSDTYLAEIEVDLIGESGDQTFTSCQDGYFGFGKLDPGLYLVWPKLGPDALTTTSNRPKRTIEAIREGALTLVAFGDSLPVEGDQERFPERMASRLGALAQVELHNVARSGSTSQDWLPDGWMFQEQLVPVLAEADLVVVSLGGNDILYWADDRFSSGDFAEIEAEFQAELDRILDNLLTILHAVREHNPRVDIAFLLYPNYAITNRWAEWLGPLQDFVIDLLGNGLRNMRASLEPAEDLLLIDMFGAVETSGLDLDELLADELHFNDAGHDFVADQALLALGAARIGPGAFGAEKTFGIAP